MDRENVLEVGFVLLALGFLTGLGALIGGRLVGDRARNRGRDQIVQRGSVPPERHQQWSASPR
jgi:hypothetical protein